MQALAHLLDRGPAHIGECDGGSAFVAGIGGPRYQAGVGERRDVSGDDGAVQTDQCGEVGDRGGAAARDAGSQVPMGARAEELYEAFAAAGNGGLDFSAIIRTL